MVTHTYPRYQGDSTAPFVDAIARSLSDRGHSIDVVLPYHPEFRHSSDDGLRFFPYRYSPFEAWTPWGFGNSLRGDSRLHAGVAALLPVIALTLQARIRNLLEQGDYDVVHAQWAIPNGWLAGSPARRKRVPLVISLHGSDISLAERYAPFRYAARRAFDGARAISAPSDHLRSRAEALGVDPGKVETIRWGIDTRTFAPRPADPALRQRLLGGDKSDALLFAAVGRLVECKGFEYLIEAAARVPGIRVAIIGDGELRPELERKAHALAAPVTFVGALPHDLVADALVAADAVVVPFVVDRAGRVDGFGMTVLEALAAGRPLLATRVGSIPELVTDGSNGLLVPEKDVHALAAAMERLKREPQERQRLADEGRRTALASLTWDDTARAFEAWYERAFRR
jgi:phosphatidylinositol alpha-1,6-mannosyltransferase